MFDRRTTAWFNADENFTGENEPSIMQQVPSPSSPNPGVSEQAADARVTIKPQNTNNRSAERRSDRIGRILPIHF